MTSTSSHAIRRVFLAILAVLLGVVAAPPAASAAPIEPDVSPPTVSVSVISTDCYGEGADLELRVTVAPNLFGSDSIVVSEGSYSEMLTPTSTTTDVIMSVEPFGDPTFTIVWSGLIGDAVVELDRTSATFTNPCAVPDPVVDYGVTATMSSVSVCPGESADVRVTMGWDWANADGSETSLTVSSSKPSAFSVIADGYTGWDASANQWRANHRGTDDSLGWVATIRVFEPQTITFTTAPATGGRLSDSASVTVGESSNCFETDADVTFLGDNLVCAGDERQIRLDVANNGYLDYSDASFQFDTLPVGVDFVAPVGFTGRWEPETIPGFGSDSLTITIRFTQDPTTSLPISVSYATPGSSPSTFGSSLRSYEAGDCGSPDLDIAVDWPADTDVCLPDTRPVTIRISNSGTAPSSPTTVALGVTGDVAWSGDGISGGTWNVPAIAPGENATVNATLTFSGPATAASVTFTGRPNIQGFSTATCAPEATLEVDWPPTPTCVGDVKNVTVRVVNTGSVPFPAGAVSLDATSGTLVWSGGGVTGGDTWSFGEIAVGGTATLNTTITFADVPDTATVVLGSQSLQQTFTEDDGCIDPTPSAELLVTWPTQTVVCPGDSQQVTVRVRNTGDVPFPAGTVGLGSTGDTVLFAGPGVSALGYSFAEIPVNTTRSVQVTMFFAGPDTVEISLGDQTLSQAFTEGICIDLNPKADFSVTWPPVTSVCPSDQRTAILRIFNSGDVEYPGNSAELSSADGNVTFLVGGVDVTEVSYDDIAVGETATIAVVMRFTGPDTVTVIFNESELVSAVVAFVDSGSVGDTRPSFSQTFTEGTCIDPTPQASFEVFWPDTTVVCPGDAAGVTIRIVNSGDVPFPAGSVELGSTDGSIVWSGVGVNAAGVAWDFDEIPVGEAAEANLELTFPAGADTASIGFGDDLRTLAFTEGDCVESAPDLSVTATGMFPTVCQGETVQVQISVTWTASDPDVDEFADGASGTATLQLTADAPVSVVEPLDATFSGNGPWMIDEADIADQAVRSGTITVEVTGPTTLQLNSSSTFDEIDDGNDEAVVEINQAKAGCDETDASVQVADALACLGDDITIPVTVDVVDAFGLMGLGSVSGMELLITLADGSTTTATVPPVLIGSSVVVEVPVAVTALGLFSVSLVDQVDLDSSNDLATAEFIEDEGCEVEETTTTTVVEPEETTTTTVVEPEETTTTTVVEPEETTTTTVAEPEETTTTTVAEPEETTTTTVAEPEETTTTTVAEPEPEPETTTTTVAEPEETTTTTVLTTTVAPTVPPTTEAPTTTQTSLLLTSTTTPPTTIAPVSTSVVAEVTTTLAETTTTEVETTTTEAETTTTVAETTTTVAEETSTTVQALAATTPDTAAAVEETTTTEAETTTSTVEVQGTVQEREEEQAAPEIEVPIDRSDVIPALVPGEELELVVPGDVCDGELSVTIGGQDVTRASSFNDGELRVDVATAGFEIGDKELVVLCDGEPVAERTVTFVLPVDEGGGGGSRSLVVVMLFALASAGAWVVTNQASGANSVGRKEEVAA